MQLKRAMPLLGFVVFGLLLWWGLAANRDLHEIPSPLVGKAVPSFQLPLLEAPGEQADNSRLLGQVTLLNFWGSWCHVCVQEHPFLQQLHDNGITIVGISYRDNRADAKEWLEKHGNPYQQVWLDAEGHLAIDLGVYGAPETFLVDKQGIVRYKRVGMVNQEIWSRDMEPLYQQLLQE